MNGRKYEMQFGWPGDRGLGMKLIQQVISGTKTATCCPAELFDDGELEWIQDHIGQIIPLVDKDGGVHGHVKLTDVATTTWGDPEPRLVRGEGCKTVAELHAAHDGVWDDELQSPLNGSTQVIAEYFELVRPEPPSAG